MVGSPDSRIRCRKVCGGVATQRIFFHHFLILLLAAYFFADSGTGAKERNSVMTSSSPTWLKSS